MVNKSNNSVEDVVPSEGVLTNMSALERRRFLFKSVGKGAAAGVALGVPLSSYATTGDNGERKLGYHHKSGTSSELHHCSVSGMQSAIASRDLNNTTLAAGYSPGYWGQLDGNSCVKVSDSGDSTVWGPKMKQTFPSALSNWSWNTLVSDVLGSNSTVGANVTLGMLMAVGDGRCSNGSHTVTYGNFSNKVDVHWICAILNAAKLYPARFPYSATKIQGVANGTDTTLNRDALYELVTSLEGTGGL